MIPTHIPMFRLGPRWPKGLAVVAAEATTSGEVSAPIAAVAIHMGQVEAITHYTGGGKSAAGPGALLLLGNLSCLHQQPCALSACSGRHRFVCSPACARPFTVIQSQFFLLPTTFLKPCRAAPPAGQQ